MKNVKYLVITLLALFISSLQVKADTTDYSADFKKLTQDGTIVFNKSIQPTNDAFFEYIFYEYLAALDTDVNFVYEKCNETYTECNVYIKDDYDNRLEEHSVQFSYVSSDAAILEAITEKVDSIPDNDRNFSIEDMELVNFLVAVDFDPEGIAAYQENYIAGYSGKLRNYLGNANYTALFYLGMGTADNILLSGFGNLLVYYEDVLYAVDGSVGSGRENVIYIPTNTEKTPEAYANAAQDRVQKYLGRTDVTVTTKGELASTSLNDYAYDYLFDEKTMLDAVYYLNYNNKSVPFYVAASDTKATYSNHETVDIESNVEIEISDPSTPRDTVVSAEIVEAEEIKDIIAESGYSVKNSISYDINLFSPSLNVNITKSSDSNLFKVTLLIPSELKGKKLLVIYVDEKGNIVEYDTTVDEESVSFLTDHFSTYTIVEDNSSSIAPPDTSDSIGKSIVLIITSIIVLAGTTLYIRKNN